MMEYGMDRREFLRRCAMFGAAAGASWMFGGAQRLFASPADAFPDLVAVKGGAPAAMFDAGIAALGGIRRFVSRGQTVLIKPNMAWDVPPENAANTNPLLVARIVEHCREAGAKRVYVFDHTCDSWQRCYRSSGIEESARQAGAQVVPADTREYYQKVDIPGGVVLTSAEVHELVLESDVLINVPILKHHSSTRLTSAMKNLMGTVWNRQAFHGRGLHQSIADYLHVRQPDLNVIDAYDVMMSHGPRGYGTGVLERKGMQILSTDIVAVDTAAAMTWGIEPERIEYIGHAEAHGFGTGALDRLDIRRITL